MGEANSGARMMLLVTDFDRRFSVDDGNPKLLGSHDKLTAREALRAASQAAPSARILVDGHPIEAEQLQALASRDRRVSIACLTTTPNPQIESELTAKDETGDGQLTMPLFPGKNTDNDDFIRPRD